jgi:hypothetical protein
MLVHGGFVLGEVNAEGGGGAFQLVAVELAYARDVAFDDIASQDSHAVPLLTGRTWPAQRPGGR